ncbi:alpha-amylase/4-alpha-glucanotransferase domain-containing protein [Nitratiruptor sp. SB155-2]|uniref:alpha-amylase/4-alpha-glucanotransferase domain-containing protein n=1 Tax=Nitratiruptor sp. (strain SB155-2) TaxID=387092 RepID=UPI00015871C4|nr:alpha-amylase/4-alpha-glucanotransferase domain-containing protein [Nitratiruptor sp. SB155-2]BAF70051.1 4-alpha-glucanotransferase [Nitratiruptor sp. SB155-2]
MSSFYFGLHMHQPTNNLPEAVENAVKRCYRPLFQTLRKYPDFRFALHCSGWLFEEIRTKYPDVFEDILYLNEQGSIEFFTGGFYEPVLASIPREDRTVQIQKLNNYIEKLFHKKPKGLWLTERVWESSVATDFTECDIEYVTVDDYHFLASGFDKEELDGYFFSEESGNRFALFPISQKLRYAIPFYPVNDAIEAICSFENAILFDDAEKFGLWPNTYEWVYKEGWLESFIQKVLQSVQIEHFESMLSKRANGLAYLCNVSYYEMGEWSLRSKDTLELEKLKATVGKEYFETIGIKFIRGGIWRNFFVKYEESNRLHKRMLDLSKKQKSEYLYKLQTNDVFWHGIFGGLYLPNLRDNAYRFVAECEKSLDDRMEVGDKDMDGYKEIEVKRDSFVWRFYEKQGGQIIELLDIASSFNFQNTLTRKFEAYHEKIFQPQNQKDVKGITTIHEMAPKISEEVKKNLFFDWYIKNSAIDHFSDASFNTQSFFQNSFKEYGDFANQPFILQKPLEFQRKGGLYLDKKYPSTLKKNYFVDTDCLQISIDFHSTYTEELLYISEWNLHFAHYETLLINAKYCCDELEFFSKKLEIKDPFTKRELHFSFNEAVQIYAVPLRTVSQNEKGFELTQQGISIAFSFAFTKNFNWDMKLCLK